MNHMNIKLNKCKIKKEKGFVNMTTIDPKDEEKFVKYLIVGMGIISFVLVLFICLVCLSGCTLSFQNISTNGTASDLVRDNQTADPDIKTDLSIPAKAL